MRYVGSLPARVPRIPVANRALVKKLQVTPGEWWEIKTYPPEKGQLGYVYAHNCKRGAIKSLSPPMGMEVKAQAREDGSVAVFARYVGLKGEHAT